MEQCCAGIDVSKAGLEVMVREDGEERQAFHVSNTDSGCRSLTKQLSKYRVGMVAMEATGGYERRAWKHLAEVGFPVAVMNPQRAKAFAQFKGRLSKTDKVDAALLALIAEQARLTPSMLPDPVQEAFSALVTRRNQVIGMLTMEKNRSGQAAEAVEGLVAQHINVLTAERKHLDREIEKAVQLNPQWAEKSRLLQSVKGIGPVTSAAILAYLPEAGALSHKKLAALVGVAPFASDSGTRSGKRFIRGGRGVVRRALYMAALSAKSSNPEVRSLYVRLLARGKVKKVALVACMHKLLRIINAMLRTGQSWDPDWRGAPVLSSKPREIDSSAQLVLTTDQSNHADGSSSRGDGAAVRPRQLIPVDLAPAILRPEFDLTS
jgi:transposase